MRARERLPRSPAPPSGPSNTHRSVFAELAEGGEGLLVGFAHLLDELLHLGRDDVALRALRLGHVLLLLVPIIADGCGDGRVSVTRPRCHPAPPAQGGARPLGILCPPPGAG